MQATDRGQAREAARRWLIKRALRKRRERKDVERYIRGYRQAPQTEAELGWVDEVNRELLGEVSWE